MSKKKRNIKLDYEHTLIDVKKIDPSPFQVRKYFDEDKLNSIVTSKIRGSKVSKEAESLLRKFAQQVEKIFKNLPKPLEWRSFYRHELPILMDICEEVQKVSIQNDLNRSQIRALETLKEVSLEEFK